jgi:hypothetical protein
MVTTGGSMSTEGETLQVSVVLWGTWSETSVAPSQLTQFWQIARHRTLSYPLSMPCFVTTAPSGETCKYAMAPITQKNLERFSTYWYAPFCCVYLGCCAAKFRSSGGTYELPCTSQVTSTHTTHHHLLTQVCHPTKHDVPTGYRRREWLWIRKTAINVIRFQLTPTRNLFYALGMSPILGMT